MDTRQQSIIDEFQGGAPLHIVGAKFGISGERVRQIAKKAGLLSRTAHSRKRWTDAEVAVLRRHYKQGKSAEQIAKMLDRTRNEVIGAAHRHVIGK